MVAARSLPSHISCANLAHFSSRTYRCIFFPSTTPSPSLRSIRRSASRKRQSVYVPAAALNVRPASHARHASRCSLFALALGRMPATSSCVKPHQPPAFELQSLPLCPEGLAQITLT